MVILESIIAAPYMIRNCCLTTGHALRENYILIGRDNEDNLYNCKLFFDTSILSDEVIIEKASLKVFCNSKDTNRFTTLIYAKVAGLWLEIPVQTLVEGRGYYEWDLTEWLKVMHPYTRFEVYLFTHPRECCHAKVFCTQQSSHPITLEVVIRRNKEKDVYEHKECKLSSKAWSYSKWINCSVYKNYVYHVYNTGTTPIEVVLNISPDKDCFVESSPMYVVEPKSLIVIEPLKYSFYIRVALRNLKDDAANLAEIWFQAQK